MPMNFKCPWVLIRDTTVLSYNVVRYVRTCLWTTKEAELLYFCFLSMYSNVFSINVLVIPQFIAASDAIRIAEQ